MKHPAAALLAIAAIFSSHSAAAEPKRPNILFIFADDQSYKTVGCYPESFPWVKTPNIDRLAASGVRFHAAYLGSWCMPSRAAILTGRHPHGVETMRMEGEYPGSAYDPNVCRFWPAVLREHGYQTAQIGKWHTGVDAGWGRDWDYQIVWNRPRHPDNAGAYYERQLLAINGEEQWTDGYPADNYTQWAVDYVRGQHRDADKPWFLWLCYGSIHGPSKPAERHKGRYATAEVPVPRDLFPPRPGKPDYLNLTQAWTKDDDGTPVAGKSGEQVGDESGKKRQGFASFVRQMNECVPAVDEGVGKLLDVLRETGQLENTLVIYTADQGFGMGEHGFRTKLGPYDATYRSPLIISQPGLTPAGTVCSTPVNAPDLTATFAALAGVEIPWSTHGRDLTPLLKNPAAPWPHACLYEHTGHHYGSDVAKILRDEPGEAVHNNVPWYVAVVQDGWKLIHYLKPNVGDELYDLKNDPDELVNQIAAPAHAGQLARMRAALQVELARTDAAFATAPTNRRQAPIDSSAKEARSPHGYQRPPNAITDILDVPPTPSVSISPTRENLLLIERTGYPPISDLAAPMIRLAGLRINPETNGPHLAPRNIGLVLQSIAAGTKRRIEIPKDARVGFPSWSPDGKRIAFTNTTARGIELWVASVADARARQLAGIAVNDAYGDAVQWMPDSGTLLVQTIGPRRGEPPARPRTPAGPTVEESSGRAGPIRTYQDLLQDAHDEALFDYYCTSQLQRIDIADGRTTRVGEPAIFRSVEPSPDGQHLLVTRNRRPYSYVLPVQRFPKEVEVWDLAGRVEFTLASLPLEDRIPIEGVPTGPRSVNWRPTEPATLVWAEALDGGDPRNKVPHRDRVMTLRAPFDREPAELAKTEQRFTGISWGEHRGFALIRDYDRDRRWSRTFQLDPDRPDGATRLVWERSINDRYGDPGSPVMRPLGNGRRAIWQHGTSIFLDGNGATPRGDRPFLDRFDLQTHKTERLFQCDDSSYESVVALLADDGSRFITSHETTSDPANYFLRSLDGDRQRLTDFPDPMPQLRKIRKELVTYQRDDGVQLSFTLYLPPDYEPGQRLPTVVWAYPREFNDPGTAGQVSGSTNRFTTIGGMSHLFFLTQGYAILDGATMPVVGDPETANDTYVDQIVASARAAIEKAAEMGVTDRGRVGVGGHSYGAFMTANLLAHCDLFRAGIARSGAYNRTLTPFGFQSERRTFWESPDVYLKMSPFAVAHRINEPILLIHGEADNNPGTFPIQSERLYQAIRGNGGTVRYVTLPHESHGYAARESVEHTLWEMISWFDKHVKHADTPTRPAGE